MTAFEHYFYVLKKALGRADLYDIWPDFESQYDEREHAWTTFRGLGDVLLLNCAQCDEPSNQRYSRCKGCVERSNWLKTRIKSPQDNLNRSGPHLFYVEFIQSNISIYPFVLKRFNIHFMRLY